MAASMGAFLLAAGEKGKRFSLPNSKIMIHQPWAACRARRPTSRSTPRHPEDRAVLNRILAERTGQPLESIERDTERDYFLTADEAKDYGLVDQVIAKRGCPSRRGEGRLAPPVAPKQRRFPTRETPFLFGYHCPYPVTRHRPWPIKKALPAKKRFIARSAARASTRSRS
jgi:hypothetical protein